MTESDLFHEGDTVFIDRKSYVLGRYWPEIRAWDLWHGGNRDMTVEVGYLRTIISGIKFKAVAA